MNGSNFQSGRQQKAYTSAPSSSIPISRQQQQQHGFLTSHQSTQLQRQQQQLLQSRQNQFNHQFGGVDGNGNGNSGLMLGNQQQQSQFLTSPNNLMMPQSAPVTFGGGMSNYAAMRQSAGGNFSFGFNQQQQQPQQQMQTINPQMLHDDHLLDELTADMLLNDDMFPLNLDGHQQSQNDLLSPSNNPNDLGDDMDDGCSPYQSTSPIIFGSSSFNPSALSAGSQGFQRSARGSGSSLSGAVNSADTKPRAIIRKARASSNAHSVNTSQEFDVDVKPGAGNSSSNSHIISQSFPGSTLSNDTINEDDSQSGSLHKHISELEKRRRRRESHNAVERRRRDNINERIQELSTMVPPLPAGEDDGKMHKGSILKRSIDYIRYLQRENEHLRHRLKRYEQSFGAIE
ncbi:hypothetical protein MIR68_001036 [Amoeboaphelidium protococcarum]|nr:hypothetical protein MIR68_001036 [Amoeboaphelidium protococcarum]